MRPPGRPSRFAIAFFAGWGTYFSVIWSRALRFDPDGNLLAGFESLWADWAAHFTFGSAMAYRKLFLDESPLLLHAPFRYPFACDLLSALLIRAGAPFFASFTWPSYVATLIFLVTLY